MLKSMTGYGAANYSQEGLSINIEVKTLNSKFLDLSLRLPRTFSEKEIYVRNLVSQTLERGKVTLNIEISNDREAVQKQSYNDELFIKYYSDLKKLADKVGGSEDELFRLALNSPDVIINNGENGFEETDWLKVNQLIEDALKNCDEFRQKEGAELQVKFEGYIAIIKSNLEEVVALDGIRVEKIRTRIKGNLLEYVDEEGLDKNRLEQEIIFYIEKLDITEEKVRLSSHLNHFIEVLNAGKSLGKKLGFISQEIGREINTIGSKANDADIQKHVVSMKEELEKIKEQALNVL